MKGKKILKYSGVLLSAVDSQQQEQVAVLKFFSTELNKRALEPRQKNSNLNSKSSNPKYHPRYWCLYMSTLYGKTWRWACSVILCSTAREVEELEEKTKLWPVGLSVVHFHRGSHIHRGNQLVPTLLASLNFIWCQEFIIIHLTGRITPHHKTTPSYSLKEFIWFILCRGKALPWNLSS